MATIDRVPEPALKLESERTPNETIVRCSGKITLETAAQFRDTIRGLIPEAKCIVLDLTNVSHIDSVGLGALVTVWSSARKKSAEEQFPEAEPPDTADPYVVKLIHVNEHIRKLLRITTLDKLFGTPDRETPDEH